MKLMRTFLAHEWRTQWRSTRFRALSGGYVLVASIPAAAAFLSSGRTPRAIGPSAYNTFLLSEQPLLTAFLVAGLAVDALSRERDEGSFSVLSVAPLSSMGYVLRRWLAVLAICIPISWMPTIISASLAFHGRHAWQLLTMFAEGWLVAVLPSMLVSSALAIALGTITGRTVLSIIFAALLFTIGLDTINSILFYAHRLNFDGPGELFSGGERGVREIMMAMRGYWFSDMPSDAGFLFRSRARTLLSRGGITAALSMLLLALSAFYLRRSRRDLRPWQIAETHQLRTLWRVANRVRDEYAPDAAAGRADVAGLAIGLLLAVVLTGCIVRRQSMFGALASARFAAETGHGIATNTTLVAEATRVDGGIQMDGTFEGRASCVIRNTGDRPQSHLSFALNANVAVQRLAIDRGTARANRVWERLDVEVAPPLVPGEARTLSFELAGLPAEIDFALQPPGNFIERWTRYRTAKESIYMSDLSRSTITPAATEVRMRLRAMDMIPVLRYSPWALRPAEEGGEGFIPETITPNTSLELRLKNPYPLAVDSCGTLDTHGQLVSRCTTALGAYVLFGGPLATRALSPAATLAYIPVHESLAEAHSQSLASSVKLASEAWPLLALPPHLVFIERPTEPGDRSWYFEYQPWRTVDQIGSLGSIFFVPEMVFTSTRPTDPNGFAAAIIAGSLRRHRRVVPNEAPFFVRFYTAVAIGRLGMRKGSAVEPGTGVPPDTRPLTNRVSVPETRLSKVLATLEYRAGAGHFVEGINDFVHGGDRPGTVKELLGAIGRRAGLDLTRTYDDYFVGEALPQLTLTDVKFQRTGDRWEVSGSVTNKATGETFVPLALRTTQGSLWQVVRVASGGRAAFTFTATGEPHSLQLDPDRVCYRLAAIGLVDNVEYRGAP